MRKSDRGPCAESGWTQNFACKYARTAAKAGNRNLPDVDRADAWRAGAVSDYLCFQDDFDILALPTAWYLLQHFFHALLVHQNLSGSDSPASADACAYPLQLLNIGIDKARHDRVVRVSSGLLN